MIIFYKQSFNEKVNIKEAITEMYPRISWEVVADTLGPAEHILVTSEVIECKIIPHEETIHPLPLNKTPTAPLYGHTELATVFTGPATCPHPEPD